MLLALGVGWNCGVVGGSTLLAASVTDELRPHVEGIRESAMGLAAAVSAPVAGVVLATGSLAAVWFVTAVVAVLVLPFAGGPRANPHGA